MRRQGGYRNLPNEDKVLSRRLAAVGETGYHPDVLVEPFGRRVADQGLFGMIRHYLELDLQAISREDAGDRFRPVALVAVVLALFVGIVQGYHAFGLGHLTAALGAVGFFGGTLLFIMNVSSRRIFGYGTVVAIQIAVWIAQGANHGSFGLVLYGLETVLAGLLLRELPVVPKRSLPLADRAHAVERETALSAASSGTSKRDESRRDDAADERPEPAGHRPPEHDRSADRRRLDRRREREQRDQCDLRPPSSARDRRDRRDHGRRHDRQHERQTYGFADRPERYPQRGDARGVPDGEQYEKRGRFPRRRRP